MRFNQKIKPGIDMENCSEEVIRQVEKIIKYGNVYGIPSRKGKRYRSAFTTEQINHLEQEFVRNPYIDSNRRKEIASFLYIPEKAVKIWFQNRRMKQKKDNDKEGGKNMEVSDVCDNVTSVKSFDCYSLPIITTSTSLESVETKLNTVKKIRHEENLSDNQPSTSNNVSVTEPIHSTVTTTSSDVFPNTKNSKVMFSDLCSKINQVKNTNTSPLNKVNKTVEQVNYESLLSFSPQDLTKKPVLQSQTLSSQEKIHDATCTSEIPFYMKGYYNPAYLPPGNIIWKPVGVAPMVGSTAVPNITFPNPGPTIQNPNDDIWKRDCNCNCHHPYAAPILLPNSSSPNMQYVLAPVPFTYSGPNV